MSETPVHLEPWTAGDLALLDAPEMMEHLGGPESPEKLADRQRRYESCLPRAAVSSRSSRT